MKPFVARRSRRTVSARYVLCIMDMRSAVHEVLHLGLDSHSQLPAISYLQLPLDQMLIQLSIDRDHTLGDRGMLL